MTLSKKIKGSIAELSVAARLLSEGWRVLFPFGEDCQYDLAAERAGKFIRVRVKYTTPRNGALEVNFRSSNNWSVIRYSLKEIDFVAAYDSATEKIYFIPASETKRSSFKLRFARTRNNQINKVNLAENFSQFLPN
ncbi:MAG: group I intron-associated PD-(D/E)XK endonuclease [Patescibacteria group bacterium]